MQKFIGCSTKGRESQEFSGFYELGEAYRKGHWDHAPLDEFLFDQIQLRKTHSVRDLLRLGSYLFQYYLLNPQIHDGAFEVGRHHYDLGNDLFTAMLDSSMSYTCGIWRDAQSLKEAQLAKLELICKKLNLQPGMRILDIGCGWGNAAEYAAREYGVSVVGLTISEEQASFARKRCADLPVEILLQDYRTFEGEFDCILSIEMIEAVGKRNLPGFFQMVHRCLKPQGAFLLQAISGDTFSRHSSSHLNEFVLWLVKYVFPNGYLPKFRELCAPAQGGFLIEDMENFGPDYDRTLAAWDKNFQAHWGEMKDQYGEEFFRMWRYYLNGCRAMFRAQLVQLYQVLYRKKGSSY